MSTVTAGSMAFRGKSLTRLPNSVDGAEVGFTRRPTDNFPICARCGKPVGEVEIECLSEVINDWRGLMEVNTGEIIVTVKCHGEVRRVSNFRGKLP